jgi:hypothetical protein
MLSNAVVKSSSGALGGGDRYSGLPKSEKRQRFIRKRISSQTGRLTVCRKMLLTLNFDFESQEEKRDYPVWRRDRIPPP